MMKEARHCGLCEEKNTFKDFCWKCSQHTEKCNRAIQKKLEALKYR